MAGSLVPGTLLSDTYRVIRLVGEGGMGEVYEVTHSRLVTQSQGEAFLATTWRPPPPCRWNPARGGCWGDNMPTYLRSSVRRRKPPVEISKHVGFRCAFPAGKR